MYVIVIEMPEAMSIFTTLRPKLKLFCLENHENGENSENDSKVKLRPISVRISAKITQPPYKIYYFFTSLEMARAQNKSANASISSLSYRDRSIDELSVHDQLALVSEDRPEEPRLIEYRKYLLNELRAAIAAVSSNEENNVMSRSLSESDLSELCGGPNDDEELIRSFTPPENADSSTGDSAVTLKSPTDDDFQNNRALLQGPNRQRREQTPPPRIPPKPVLPKKTSSSSSVSRLRQHPPSQVESSQAPPAQSTIAATSGGSSLISTKELFSPSSFSSSPLFHSSS